MFFLASLIGCFVRPNVACGAASRLSADITHAHARWAAANRQILLLADDPCAATEARLLAESDRENASLQYRQLVARLMQTS